MTPEQKLEFYRKQKIKEKYNTQFTSDELKKVFKVRKSKIPNMLNRLTQTMKKQSEDLFSQQIKTSEEKLKFFRSQGKLKQNLNECSFLKIQHDQIRCRFYSLKNGKPEMNQRLFPSFEEYVDGKNRAKLQEKFHFDVSKMERTLSSFYTKGGQNNDEVSEMRRGMIPLNTNNFRKAKGSIRRSSQIASQRSMLSRTENFNKKSSKLENLDRYSQNFIVKSEKSSKKIVKTMSNFYDSKNTKKSEYNNMIEYYDHDRPLTNQIRRKQYTLNEGQHLKALNFYRNQSEQTRKRLLNNNSTVYLEMLEILSKYHQDDIPISLQILNQVRDLMKKQYIFESLHVEKLLSDVKRANWAYLQKFEEENPENEGKDFMIQATINVLNKHFHYNLIWEKIKT